YGVRFSATKYFYVTEGQKKGQRWEGQWRVSRFDDVQRTYDSRVERTRYEHDWVDYFRPRYATLLGGGGLAQEYNRTLMDLQDRLPEVNTPYLEKEEVGHLTSTAKELFYTAYSHVRSLAPHVSQEIHVPPQAVNTQPNAIRAALDALI